MLSKEECSLNTLNLVAYSSACVLFSHLKVFCLWARKLYIWNTSFQRHGEVGDCWLKWDKAVCPEQREWAVICFRVGSSVSCSATWDLVFLMHVLHSICPAIVFFIWKMTPLFLYIGYLWFQVGTGCFQQCFFASKSRKEKVANIKRGRTGVFFKEYLVYKVGVNEGIAAEWLPKNTSLRLLLKFGVKGRPTVVLQYSWYERQKFSMLMNFQD